MSRFPVASAWLTVPQELVSKAVPVVPSDIEDIRDGLRFNAAVALTVATTDTGAVSFIVPDDAQATLTIDMTNANADLTYTAVDHGIEGNDISVTHTDPSGNDEPLGVSVSGTDITVSLATGEAGAITSTAAEVAAAIAANADAAALVTCTAEGTGAGVVNAETKTSLAGGANKRLVYLKPPRVSASAAPATFTLYEDKTFTGGDPVTPLNRLRTGSAARVSMASLADATLVDGDNDLALDSIALAAAGHDYMGGEEDNNEWVLGPGNYVLAGLNSNAGNSVLGFQLRWTERDPDTM